MPTDTHGSVGYPIPWWAVSSLIDPSPDQGSSAKERRDLMVWLLLTLALYGAGFMPVIFLDRYIIHIAVPLIMVTWMTVIFYAGRRNLEARPAIWRVSGGFYFLSRT